METVRVKLGSRSYAIEIAPGLMDELGNRIREAVGPGPSRAALITNPTVSALFGRRVLRSLKSAGFSVTRIEVGDGERYKSLRTAEKVITTLIEERFERSDIIIALGGGVIGDLAGCVAATYQRGVRVIQVPTTLLAQIDSSVGGKTAVNHKLGKNLIGAFHQPSLVVIDPETLTTLPSRQVTAGLCEALKYGVIKDRRLFFRIFRNIDRLQNFESSEITHLVARCCRIKADIVERDEREGGLRRILNFGHTVGHALESVTGYRRFLHGEAVGLGMLAASGIAGRIGMLADGERTDIREAVGTIGRFPRTDDLALGDIMSAMQRDKKVESGNLILILPSEIGAVQVRNDVSPRVIQQAVRETLLQVGEA